MQNVCGIAAIEQKELMQGQEKKKKNKKQVYIKIINSLKSCQYNEWKE